MFSFPFFNLLLFVSHLKFYDFEFVTRTAAVRKSTIPFNALWLDLNLLFNSTRLREKYRRSRHKTSLQMSPPGFKTSSNPFYLAENDS